MIPSRIGRYEIVAPLAAGGMAEILLGKLTGAVGFERLVVIKRILPELAEDDEVVRMFLDEARIMSMIRHPNVVDVYELDRDEDDLFMVMELLEGESLLSIMRRSELRGERLPYWLAAHIACRACAGLSAAHSLRGPSGAPLGVVHRDISPSNIFVTYAGGVKVLDFGIAKFRTRRAATEAGTIKGKVPYMSPEQCRGRKMDHRSDLFSLGTVLYEASTGTRLFPRLPNAETMRVITEDPVVSPRELDPTYPEILEAICLRALQRAPDDRYQTAAAMQRDLWQALRRLAPDDDPPEIALARVMGRFFEQRILDKRELRRLMSEGSAIGAVPPLHIEDIRAGDSALRSLPRGSELAQRGDRTLSIDIHSHPTVIQKQHTQTISVPLAERAQRRTPSHRLFWLIPMLLAAGALTGLSIATMFLSAPDMQLESVPLPVGTIPIESTAASALGEATGQGEATARELGRAKLRLESAPRGAAIRIDGVVRGATPLELLVPRSSRAQTIELDLPGYRRYRVGVIPDQDRIIDVDLARAP